MDDLWIFGYGSLIWNPGFEPEETHSALIDDMHRRLCIYSYVHRGTPQKPGLVFGLDRGGSCQGMAFKVFDHQRDEVMAYLRKRELVTNAYREILHPARLDDGRTVEAVTYVVDRNHEQYAKGLTHEQLLRHIREGVGKSGNNIDYVINTVHRLKEMGIHEPAFERLAAELEQDC